MKYGTRAEGQFFICPLCPLFKSFATAGLDPLIHLQKKRHGPPSLGAQAALGEKENVGGRSELRGKARKKRGARRDGR